MSMLCQTCDGYGIMTLEPKNWLAPCISCSANQTLEYMLKRKDKAIQFENLKEEKKLIQEHNEKIRGGRK